MSGKSEAARMKQNPTGLFAGFALVLALLGGVAWFNLRQDAHARESARWVAHTHQVRYALSELLSVMQDIETGARGYVVAGVAGIFAAV
jgi:methyl-accepting chemotaxis protein